VGASRAARTGLGLGLSIVRAVATAHDGRLDVRALPAGGLAVVVEFDGLALPPADQAFGRDSEPDISRL
jgi:signal transduction histidine kinase